MIHDLTPPSGLWPVIGDTGFGDGTASERGFEVYATPDMAVGLWFCDHWNGPMAPWPHDELVIVHAGHVAIRLVDGAEHTFGAGSAFCLPKGLVCAWEQPGPLRMTYMTYDGGIAVAGAKLHRIEPAMRLSPSTPPAPAILESEVPRQHSATVHADGSGSFSVGVWDTTAYRRKPMAFPRHELMHIVTGEVTLTCEGDKRTWRPGETFFVPHGTVVDWAGNGSLRKVFCCLTREAA